MGWIVRDAVDRLRHEIGAYRWHEWRTCAERVGITVVLVDTDIMVDLGCWPAAIVGRTVLVDRNVDVRTRARHVWHELGHALLHAGGADDWFRLPGGARIVGKMERQAREFVDTFPIWD